MFPGPGFSPSATVSRMDALWLTDGWTAFSHPVLETEKWKLCHPSCVTATLSWETRTLGFHMGFFWGGVGGVRDNGGLWQQPGLLTAWPQTHCTCLCLFSTL